MGAGTALPSLVCAACGACVVATDREDGKRVLSNIKNTVLTNNPVHFVSKGQVTPVFLDVTVLGFSYGCFTEEFVAQNPFDYIIGADLFYDNKKSLL